LEKVVGVGAKGVWGSREEMDDPGGRGRGRGPDRVNPGRGTDPRFFGQKDAHPQAEADLLHAQKRTRGMQKGAGDQPGQSGGLSQQPKRHYIEETEEGSEAVLPDG